MAQPIKGKNRPDQSILRVENMAPPQPMQIRKGGAFSGWPMIVAWVGMLIFALHACTHMVAAGDTWVAMACGRHFVNRGQAAKGLLPFRVDTNEPFSANSHKPGPTPEEVKTWPKWAQSITDIVGLDIVKYWHPTGWVNQNWLTHVIFYLLVPKSSYADGLNFTSNALVYWKFAVYILTVVCVYYTGVKLGVNPALSAVFACFAMFIGRSFLDIRPAGFSNLLVAVFLLILVLAAYRNILYIWLLVPITVFWCNVHGGYIYAFIMLIAFVGLHLPTAIQKKKPLILSVAVYVFFLVCVAKILGISGPLIFLMVLAYLIMAAILHAFRQKIVSVSPRALCHIVAATIVSFLAVIIFNPLHLTNLTHTFVISVSKDAERWRDVHEWHPAFAWDNPVGTAVPFLVMFIIALVVLAVWAVVLILTSRSVTRSPKRKATATEEYRWPKIDLPVLLIAALTIYLAIRSRRFIPIAAVAACPVIAMFVDQIIRIISATLNLRRRSRLAVLPMPANLRLAFACAGVVAVLFFGIWWGFKFKRVYLDPWPADPNLTSVFMRMSASDAKPFCACKFIKDNNLKGKMFNYWTEGGFIAWGQQPDPNTGHIGLKLFMDGRAQAAYNVPAFNLWTAIMAGGPTVQSAHVRGHTLTTEDYREVGEWIDQQLKKQNVWVVLMPAAQFDSPFAKGLDYCPNWPLVLMNNKDRLFVDVTTPRGRDLYDGMFNGKTVFPDDFCKNLTLAHNLLLFGKGAAAKNQGLDLVFKAYSVNPSPAAMFEVVIVAARFSETRPRVDDFCKQVVDDFVKNKMLYTGQNGYRLRLEAIRLASIHSQKVAQIRNDTNLAGFYAAQIQNCENERNRLSETQRW